MPNSESNDIAGRVVRDALLGLFGAYAVTVAICYPGLGNWKDALLGAMLPALFAGPFVGLLLTLRAYMASVDGSPSVDDPE